MNQTRKILVQLLVLVLVAAGLGSYAWFGVFQKDQVEKKKKDHELRLFAPQKVDERQADGGIAAAAFVKLVVNVKGGGTTVVEREGKDWFITSPVKGRADAFMVDGITSQLQTAKFRDTLEEDPDAATLAKYGLDDPEFTVEATAEVNGETRSVKLVGGKENTFDGSIYVRRNAEKPVFTAEGGARFMLSRSTFDLREKAVFKLDEPKVQQITVKSKNNAYTVQREGNSKLWNLTKPNAEPADGPSVVSMILGLGQERAQLFPDDTEATRKALGFDQPQLEATITLEGGQLVHLKATHAVVDGGDVFYGLREDAFGATLALVGQGVMQLDRNPADLHDRTVVRFRRELITKVVFHDASGGEVVVQRDSPDASAESWRVVAPRPAKAKVFRVTGALWTLGNMKALAPGEEHPKDWARYGVDAKSKFIAVFGDDGKEIGRLTIGKEVPNKQGAFYVRGTRDQVFESDGSRFGEFPFSLEAVIDEPDAGVSDAGP